ncbi:hypothetical protein, conserved [Eimeria maxima]|uniref:Uncharacterized protein n=1 Tax=Eimeria maxima TaxID=5804 RepID=U6MCC4_EIMMA|nr:hypothetical protein, conserved [Eimeria maxima]CDJ60713.1 hypothetical protein, conserved [Eimeria maxima]
MDSLEEPRTKHLYVTPCSPYRRFAEAQPARQELYDAVAGDDLDTLRNYRAYWNTPICTYRQPGYGEIYTTPQLCLLLQQERLLNYLLADPCIEVEARSSPSGWTLLMIACAADASLGVVSLILQRARSKDHINTISVSGNTALDCARPGSSVYLFLVDQGALLAEEIYGASGSGGDDVVDTDFRGRVLRDKAKEAPEGLESKKQEQSRSTSRVGKGEAPRSPSLEQSLRDPTLSPNRASQEKLPRSCGRPSASPSQGSCGREAVLKKRQPTSLPKRGAHRGRQPKATGAVGKLEMKARTLSPEHSAKDTNMKPTDSARPDAVPLASGALRRPSGNHRQANAMALSTESPAAEATPELLAQERKQPDEGRRENAETVSFSAVKPPTATVSRQEGGQRHADSVKHAKGSPVAKSMRRVSSISRRDLPLKVSRPQMPLQKEDVADTDSPVEPPLKGGSSKDTKNTAPTTLLLKGDYSTKTVLKEQHTLSKQFHRLASVGFAHRQPSSAVEISATQEEQAETHQQTDSPSESMRSFAEAEGPHVPSNLPKFTSRPVGVHDRPKAQVGTLVPAGGTAEESQIVGPRQVSVEVKEHAPAAADSGGGSPRELDEPGEGQNVPVAEVDIPFSERVLRKEDSSSCQQSPAISTPGEKQPPVSLFLKKTTSGDAHVTAPKSALAMVPSTQQQQLLSENFTAEQTEATSTASQRLAVSRSDLQKSEPNATISHSNTYSPAAMKSGAAALSSWPST